MNNKAVATKVIVVIHTPDGTVALFVLHRVELGSVLTDVTPAFHARVVTPSLVSTCSVLLTDTTAILAVHALHRPPAFVWVHPPG